MLARRQFVKGLSALSYARVQGANQRVRIGGMGTGGRCQSLLNLAVQAGCDLVAVCDVYEPRRTQVKQKLAPGAREFVDYQKLLEQKDIDAVVIGSPDHWHVPMTIDAIRAGKDVYVEKPVSHTIAEGEELARAMLGSRQIVQVGYQQRSWDHFVEARKLMPKLGKVTLVLASWYQAYYRTARGPVEADPQKLDWKRFLGSAREQPFDPVRFRHWRWFWDFGGGHLTDLYSHYGDVIHWYMDQDAPLAAQAMGGSYALPQFECPDTITAAWKYPGFAINYTGTLVGSLDGGNIVFRGSRAVMKINRDGFAIYPEGAVPSEKTHYPDAEIQMRSLEDGTRAHMANFLDCVRSRKPPNAPPQVGISAARAAHLANQTLLTSTRLSP